MNKSKIILLLLLMGLLSLSVVTAATPESDETIIGGDVTIDYAVYGDLFVIAGKVTVDAPVTGDVIVAAGDVSINGNVSGNVIVAGGIVTINSAIGELIAAGGEIKINESAIIENDAKIVAETVTFKGTVIGALEVYADHFTSQGTYGSLEYHEDYSGLEDIVHTNFSQFHRILRIIGLVLLIGYFLVGVALVKIVPSLFSSAYDIMNTNPIVTTVVGLALIITALILSLTLLITIIGIPFALFVVLVTALAFFCSTLVMSYVIGKKILSLAKKQTGDVIAFLIGFIILEICYRIPYAGAVIHIIVWMAGIGVLFYVLKDREFRTPVV